MMSKLEHWAHRLFPKLSFDDFVERLEKLGGKKEIQVILHHCLAVVHSAARTKWFLVVLEHLN
jgi:Replication Fork Protection Component Swi3